MGRDRQPERPGRDDKEGKAAIGVHNRRSRLHVAPRGEYHLSARDDGPILIGNGSGNASRHLRDWGFGELKEFSGEFGPLLCPRTYALPTYQAKRKRPPESMRLDRQSANVPLCVQMK